MFPEPTTSVFAFCHVTVRSDDVFILNEYLGISHYNQEFSQLESADESSYLGKNLMQCFFRIIPPSMYEHIETIVPDMVIKKTQTIHAHDQASCYHYQIWGPCMETDDQELSSS